ncbi:OMPdecase-domain-containing protein [Violaceomyces palustris]|uniref:OMPdecase-domain-containing protein n=1 Tax=Violaceomyces palustris TaxID=1673888 RepID=A0ACD0P387_9BASI|nr:OMPdecase-domain-containing protein [Violaceomyces palustris]
MSFQTNSIVKKTYGSRVSSQANAAAKQLLETMERKKSNLCVSIDVTNKSDLLAVAEAVGPDVCLVKTHIDIVEDFDMDLVEKLTALSKEHDFMIFEDRKFADIGNTVSLQYSAGVHKIASWSHITNAHLVPGPGIISGLAKAGEPLGRGLLLLAEMSSAGALTKGDYTKACVQAAKDDKSGFVCGFIAMSRVDEADGPCEKDLLVLTPGVGLDVKGDALGQQYRTPDQVVRQSGCDIIIVGRGIYGVLMTEEGKADKVTAMNKVREQGSRYKKAGWDAYLARIDDATRPPRHRRRRRPGGGGKKRDDLSEVEIKAKVKKSERKASLSSPFETSPRKKQKAIKLDLEPHEAHPAPSRWEETYRVLEKQRARILAPVDTMGCEENGREERRADSFRKDKESQEDRGKRERLTTLVSLMLSSQTKDPVTAEAVYNLQRNLRNGLDLGSLLEADEATISSSISKVGFWRRKTGYLKSVARILRDDFGGDVPRTVDELCSLPGVGPKMAFLALQSMGISVGIGVDTHVHRISNRLGWNRPPSKNPEETRLNLQSWLPKELHPKINKLLVGFGQVICVPVGPRCDLCKVGAKGLCPSFKKLDDKSISNRVKVHLVGDSDDDSSDDDDKGGKGKAKVKGRKKADVVKVEMKMEEVGGGRSQGRSTRVKMESIHDADQVSASLEW